MAQLGNLNPNDRIVNNRWMSPDSERTPKDIDFAASGIEH